MSRLRGFVSVSTGDKIRLVVAAGLLLMIPGGFWALSFSRVRTALVGIGDFLSGWIPGDPTPEHIVRVVEVADHNLPGTRTCLVRSTSAEALLRLYGHAPDHRIGVRKQTDSELIAHSWLEYNDVVLIGDHDDLRAFERLPSLEQGRLR